MVSYFYETEFEISAGFGRQNDKKFESLSIRW